MLKVRFVFNLCTHTHPEIWIVFNFPSKIILIYTPSSLLILSLPVWPCVKVYFVYSIESWSFLLLIVDLMTVFIHIIFRHIHLIFNLISFLDAIFYFKWSPSSFDLFFRVYFPFILHALSFKILDILNPYRFHHHYIPLPTNLSHLSFQLPYKMKWFFITWHIQLDRHLNPPLHFIFIYTRPWIITDSLRVFFHDINMIIIHFNRLLRSTAPRIWHHVRVCKYT